MSFEAARPGTLPVEAAEKLLREGKKCQGTTLVVPQKTNKTCGL
jgi:hypothetical protein